MVVAVLKQRQVHMEKKYGMLVQNESFIIYLSATQQVISSSIVVCTKHNFVMQRLDNIIRDLYQHTLV